MGEDRKPQSELIGSHPMSAGAIGKQIQLLLFDTVFHVTPGTIKLLVQNARCESGRLDRIAPAVLGQVGDDKARIFAFG